MAPSAITVLLLVLTITSSAAAKKVSATGMRIRLYNACPFPVWPAWFSSSSQQIAGGAPMQLDSWKSADVWAPLGWNGRFWGRTVCTFDIYGGGSCETGDCRGKLECQTPGTTPATLAGFTGSTNYDVSVVDGYNLPIRVQPNDAKCKAAGCHSDMNSQCPNELAIRNKAGHVVACRSACLAFGDPSLCCTGHFNSPTICRPSYYSEIFKRSCPDAVTYAHDASAFSCPAATWYTITFCP